MNAYYPNNALKTLDAKMAYLKGRGAQKAAQAVAGAIVAGNARDRTEGRDKNGQAVAPLKSKRTGKYRGASGPPLAPFGAASRVVTNFHAVARRRGGAWQVAAGWVNVVARRGVPFLPFHDRGGSRLPKRSIFGISPRTWAQIRPIVEQWVKGVKGVKVATTTPRAAAKSKPKR